MMSRQFSLQYLLRQLTNFHETCHEHHATAGYQHLYFSLSHHQSYLHGTLANLRGGGLY
jgi:hypothetical protein